MLLLNLLKNNSKLFSYQLRSYLKFLRYSVRKPENKSPFVRQFILKCLNSRYEYSDLNKIDDYINLLKSKKDILEIEDYGVGSRVFKSNKRRVSKMAKVSGSSLNDAKILYKLSKCYKPEKILELGSSLAISTFALHLGWRDAKITSIEGSKAIVDWNELNTSIYFKNVNFINNYFDKYLAELEESDKFDIIYVDGNHSYEATIKYFNILKNHIHSKSVIIFDDIYWSEEMSAAWKDISKDNSVVISVDTFSFGLLFFDESYQKESIAIRA